MSIDHTTEPTPEMFIRLKEQLDQRKTMTLEPIPGNDPDLGSALMRIPQEELETSILDIAMNATASKGDRPDWPTRFEAAKLGMQRSSLHGWEFWQLGIAINMVKSDDQAKLLRANGDQLSRHFWREHLPALIVADVGLSATKAVGNRLLRLPQVRANRFEVVHAHILAALVIVVNSCACCAAVHYFISLASYE